MLKSSDPELESIFLDAIFQAPHSVRLERIRNGFKRAVFSENYVLAFIFRAYEYWLSQDYEKARIAAEHAKYLDGWWLFADLCLAHTFRSQAGLETNSARKENLIQKAQEKYEGILSSDSADPKLRIVVLHSLGNLNGLRFWSKFNVYKKQNVEQRNLTETQIDDILSFLGTVMNYDLAAMKLEENSGLKYAPSHNRLGDWRLVMVAKGLIPEDRCLETLAEAIGYFDEAIARGGTEYAPPFRFKARAILETAVREDDRTWPKRVLELLNLAVKSAPNDPDIYGDIDAVLKSRSALSIPYEDRLRLTLGTSVYSKEEAIRRYFLTPRLPNEEPWKNILLILKRWGSYTPTVTTPGRTTFGGGYFIDWMGYRIAIDPGFDFLRNFSEYGFNIVDLDCVIVTHNHSDHTADLDRIFGLIYERIEYTKNLSNDDQSKNRIACEQTERLEESLFLLPPSVRNRLAPVISKFWKSRRKIKNLALSKPIKLHDKRITLIPVRTEGHFDLSSKPAFGLKFKLRAEVSDPISCQVGITGDTGYYGTLATDFADCEVIVAHVSTVSDLLPEISSHDLNTTMPRPSFASDFSRFKGYYRKHLGFWGTARLLADLYEKDPERERLVLLSEIGEELSYQRFNLIEYLQDTAKQMAGSPEDWSRKIKVRISDIGTRIDLSDPSEVRCQFGGIFCPHLGYPYERIVGIKDPRFPHLPLKDVELQYLCLTHGTFVEKLWSAGQD